MALLMKISILYPEILLTKCDLAKSLGFFLENKVLAGD